MAVARGDATVAKKQKSFFAEPAFLMAAAIVVAGMGIVYFTGTIGVEECKVRRQARETGGNPETCRKEGKGRKCSNLPLNCMGVQPKATEEAAPKVKAKGVEGYQSIFAPKNLQEQVDSDKEQN